MSSLPTHTQPTDALPRLGLGVPPAVAARAADLRPANSGRELQGRYLEAEIRRWMLDVSAESPAPEPGRVGALTSRHGATRRERAVARRYRARRALCV